MVRPLCSLNLNSLLNSTLPCSGWGCSQQVLLRNHPVCVQQVDVLQGTLRLPLPSIRHHVAHVCSILAGRIAQGGMAAQVSPGVLSYAQRLRVSTSSLPCRSATSEALRVPILTKLFSYLRTKVIPTGMTTSLDIGLSNLSLKLITLSFYSKSVASPPWLLKLSRHEQLWSSHRP